MPEEVVKGEGKVRQKGKLFGGIAVMMTGLTLSEITILQPIMGEPAGTLPGVRIVEGTLLSAIGFKMLNNVEREFTEEQMQEYMKPRLPLE
ncbi:hypothetical protein BH10PAT3_BH10PAT3_4780 [soil metagenome]